jgi:hypothetical protein
VLRKRGIERDMSIILREDQEELAEIVELELAPDVRAIYTE